VLKEFHGQLLLPLSFSIVNSSFPSVALNLSLKVVDLLYMVTGNRYQNMIISENHKIELTKNAIGDIFFIKNKTADTIANIFTKIIIAFISGLVINGNGVPV